MTVLFYSCRFRLLVSSSCTVGTFHPAGISETCASFNYENFSLLLGRLSWRLRLPPKRVSSSMAPKNIFPNDT